MIDPCDRRAHTLMVSVAGPNIAFSTVTCGAVAAACRGLRPGSERRCLVGHSSGDAHEAEIEEDTCGRGVAPPESLVAEGVPMGSRAMGVSAPCTTEHQRTSVGTARCPTSRRCDHGVRGEHG